jgi:hypothetical protein
MRRRTLDRHGGDAHAANEASPLEERDGDARTRSSLQADTDIMGQWCQA